LQFFYYSNENNYELEDMLPTILIETVVANTIEKLKVEITDIFKIHTDKPVSFSINEFKGKNKITHELSSRFEEEFKNFLNIEVYNILTEISKEKSITKRITAVNEKLPLYHQFFVEIMNKFDIKIESGE
jgi:bifunctional DNase/RNase